MNYRALPILLFVMGVSHSGAYFSDENTSKATRILVGGGNRDPITLGVEVQRKLGEAVYGSVGFGYYPWDGFHGAVGADYSWRDTKRFRPLVSTALSYVGGYVPFKRTVNVNGEDSELDFEKGIFAHLAGGFQFRLCQGVGVQYTLGWRQVLYGGRYELISSTRPKAAKKALDAMAGSGMLLGGKFFVEW